jgi:hypothetical protein
LVAHVVVLIKNPLGEIIMKISLVALVAGCALASSAFAVMDSPPANPPHVAVMDSPPANPPHAAVMDSPPANPPHQA